MKRDVHIIDYRADTDRGRAFLPGMRQAWLLPLYDVLSRIAGVHVLHERAAQLADVTAGEAVVDVGCGTGNLSFTILAGQPTARVTGLDPDRAALGRAARKAGRRGARLTLVQGYADRLPAEDASLDHVVSALALHHIDDEGRAGFAREAHRALRPGGRITIADFGGPATDVGGGGHGGHAAGHALRHLPHRLRSRMAQKPAVASNLDDGIATLLAGAGFADAREVDHLEHRFGRVVFVQATRPSAS